MSAPSLHCVITTIQEPTACTRSLAEVLSRDGSPLWVVGDKKGPAKYDLEGAHFYSLAAQLELPFRLARLLPVGAYTRKNLGYLLAMRQGAKCIYETDDDNRPLPGWLPRAPQVSARRVSGAGWFNVFRHFGEGCIWPRGFALGKIRQSIPLEAVESTPQTFAAPVQQGMVNGSPDVDAIWRLTLDREFSFRDQPSLYLPPGVWCPFNSQTAWWWPEAYVLMYLPSHCRFRMTDIWRSFIALRCLWALGRGMMFHAPEVYQARNAHDLLKDFEDEVPGYLHNRRLCELLEKLDLETKPKAISANLWRCYVALIAEGLFPKEELELLEAWIEDTDRLPQPA